MKSGRRFVVGLLATAMLGAIGCGSSGPDVELATVKGNVTLNGEKVTAGNVVFFNTNGFNESVPITAEGTYTVQAALGETEVFINHREPDIMPPDGRPGMPMPGKSLVPEMYANGATSGLKLTVAPGENTFNIEMTGELK